MPKQTQHKKLFRHKKGIRIGPGPFTYIPSTEGVDDTFEVICTTTDMIVARFRYWDRKVESELEARNMALTLNALRENLIAEQAYDDGTDCVQYSCDPSSGKVHPAETIDF